MLYFFLKKIFRLALQIYFRRTNVHFAQSLDPSKPTLFVSNHQSSIMDALLIGTQVPHTLYFMSRGESFGNRFKIWMYGLLNMLPIYRKEFTPEKAHLNLTMMNRFRDLLANGDSLLIFPEGISRTEPRMRKVKTGAARVALATEALHQYGLDLQLIPVGINYTNPHQFRSDVQIHFGAPIPLDEAIALHPQQERKAIRMLTQEIETQIKALTIEIEHPELDEVVLSVDQICREELLQKASHPEMPQSELKVRRAIIEAIGHYHQAAPLTLKKMKHKLLSYRTQLAHLGLDEPHFQLLFKARGWQLLFHLLASPIHLYSLLNAAPILIFTQRLTKLFLKRPDFKGSMLIGFGVLVSLLFLPLKVGICYWLCGSLWLTLLYALSLFCCFSFSLRYYTELKIFKSWLLLMLGSFEQWAAIGQLEQKRNALLEELRGFWRNYQGQHLPLY